MKKFKKGDWVYCDFELYQVENVRNNIYDVTTGIMKTSGRLALFPLTLENKMISAKQLGIQQLIIDPGFGFGKTTAHKVPVIIGEVYGDNVEIKSGLNAGEQLITEGYQSLYEGQAIATDAK